MAKFSFKSSGKTQDQITTETVTNSPVQIGIITPLQLGTTDILAMNTDLATQMHDNFRNLLLTNWGERLSLYDFGANLQPITTELVSDDDFDAEAIQRIKNATGRWMPFIDLEDFLSETDHTQNKSIAIKKITITYNIPALGVKQKGLQIFLYVI